MIVAEFLEKHPLPWRMEMGDMFDANGVCVRPSPELISTVAFLAQRAAKREIMDRLESLEKENADLKKQLALAAPDLEYHEYLF